ncbi:cytokine receptor family member B16 isoform X2 [Amphiprion ocellaris]|uniref:cytokine receptor family member B16 isoform X2 n=1 Tax=Amphiprion ocellaris TaxID=80972 RepID=UPI002410DF57|nr:cytokine receptor family member B16 isoform X2 [Amphiprion ocellaris]
MSCSVFTCKLETDIWTLPAPSRVSMDSVDMRHTLRWRPPQASCNTTVLYSVQYQGEFELLLRNGSWLDAAECQQIPGTHCDLSLDLGSDSDYNLQVRAQCGSQRSAWTRLSRAFNRRDTLMTVPEMSVTTSSDALQVTFNKLPPSAAVSVTVWKEGDEMQAAVFSMPSEQTVLHVAALQVGVMYCVSAQVVLDSGLHSSSTDTRCVSITGAAAWKRPTTVTVTVIVIVMAGLLFALFWSVVHCRPDACQTYFHKEPLPQSLKGDWSVQIPMSPQEAELGEVCERIPALLSVDSERRASKTDAEFTAHLDNHKY